MQVEGDVKCMQTNFSGHGLRFRSYGSFLLAFKNDQNFGLYSPWGSKSRIGAKKFIQVGIDVRCIHTNFGWRDVSGFEDIATFKNGQISLSDRGL